MNVRRVYESTIIINAALEDNDIDSVINKITNYVENHGGVILETDKWGRKRLAYPINKKYNGYYVHIVFESLPVNLPIIERFFILEDTVLRHLTLILPDKLRQYRKEKSLAEGKEYGTNLISGTDTIVKPEIKEDNAKIEDEVSESV
jgi:small subunit ribosomal protein S6